MNRTVVSVLAGLLALALVGAAQAADSYAGAKLGFMLPDTENQDNALNVGGLFGIQLQEFPDKYGALSAEAELTFTLIDGDRPGGGDWDATTLAGYAVYRSPGNTYLKVKAGVLWRDTNYDKSITELSVGVGGGFRINKSTAIEIEYTTIDDNIDMLSVGVNFSF
jgi:opacity protein-like surface antigen